MTFASRNDIALIVYDFDGVMTDNKVYVDDSGREFVQCNRADGLGINLIKVMNIPQIILSTETNAVVVRRAQKVGLDVIHGVDDKAGVLVNHCNDHGISLDKVLYVGNDVNDREAMMTVGWKVCPADAHSEIKKISDIVLLSKGGEGVVRELADLLQENQNLS